MQLKPTTEKLNELVSLLRERTLNDEIQWTYKDEQYILEEPELVLQANQQLHFAANYFMLSDKQYSLLVENIEDVMHPKSDAIVGELVDALAVKEEVQEEVIEEDELTATEEEVTEETIVEGDEL